MSWLAAARKRVFEALASSASALARMSSALRRSSSRVTFLDAPFERFIGDRQLLLCGDACRDIGVSRHHAAIRKRVGPDLDHGTRGIKAQPYRIGAFEEASNPHLDEHVSVAFAIKASPRVEAHDLVELHPAFTRFCGIS